MTPKERFEISLELIEFAEFQVKRRFLATKPDATENEVEECFDIWCSQKPLLAAYEGVNLRLTHNF